MHATDEDGRASARTKNMRTSTTNDTEQICKEFADTALTVKSESDGEVLQDNIAADNSMPAPASDAEAPATNEGDEPVRSSGAWAKFSPSAFI
jgi:hypothetical protein